MKKKSIIIGIIIVILAILIGGLGYIGNYFYDLAINPHTSKDAIFGEDDDNGLEVKEDVEWLLNTSGYEDVYMNSFDDLKLHGYKMMNKNKTNKWAVVVHGYTSEGETTSSKAKHLYDMGYNVLIPDLRAHGKSEGDYIGMGWDDRKDIIDWINLIIESDKDSEIVLHGTSMGAATVLMVSGEKLPSNVKSIVADCAYTSVWNEFTYQLKELFNLPSFPVMNASSVVTKIRAGYWLGEASAIDQVKKAELPILFIHGDKDDFVPYYMMDELYENTKSEKEKLTIEGAGHAEADLVNPELYWSTVENFLNKYVK
ncbi:alpha/beta hydrolase [Romboutsia weinsteinii]|uniref:Alpha/beta hydrolase n=1 Tax=Romboutsia weinsteinii TaxID=2020949 RepID=A0A371J9H2_9FIRM|nr:alpha/beta hydrolase [Romboutsia weinsteinii]RDY29363.1 alpha/beta hydrolase [Romboutsia weinsteinii]